MNIPTLFHISFENKNDSIWTPRLPYGYGMEPLDTKKTTKLTEYDMPRICCSESLSGCFYAVYPNVSKYFESKEYNYPHMDFYFYQAIIGNDFPTDKIYTPDFLTRAKYVWDAHITKEWDILIPVEMKQVGRVRFNNTTKGKWLTGYPYNDKRLDLREIAPKCEYKILQLYKPS